MPLLDAEEMRLYTECDHWNFFFPWMKEEPESMLAEWNRDIAELDPDETKRADAHRIAQYERDNLSELGLVFYQGGATFEDYSWVYDGKRGRLLAVRPDDIGIYSYSIWLGSTESHGAQTIWDFRAEICSEHGFDDCISAALAGFNELGA